MKKIEIPAHLLNRSFMASDPIAGYVSALYFATPEMHEFMAESAQPYVFDEGQSGYHGRPITVSLTASPEQLSLFCLKFGFAPT